MIRREFLKKASVGAGSLGVLSMYQILDAQDSQAYSTSGGMGIEAALENVERGKARNIMPEIRPEIINNPRAVFIIETHVDAQRAPNGHFSGAVEQLTNEGNRIAKQLFVKGTKSGGSTMFKPNFTFTFPHGFDRTIGVYSSPDFIGGMVDHLRDIGNTNLIAGDGPTEARNHREGGVYDGFDAHGLDMIEAGYRSFGDFKKKELNWHNVDNSTVWKRIPVIRPAGDEDNFLINVSSLKCHLTGLTTLTVKNLQGLVPKGYGQFCTPWDDVEPRAYRDGINFKRDFRKDYYERVEAEFLKHRQMGFKRWDPTGSYARYEAKGGWEALRKVMKDPADRSEFMEDVGILMQHETWMQRGLDCAQAIKPDINIVEGIIGLDGEELNRDAIGDDQLVNVVIAGGSPFEVDAVGSYVMGHDPRELWYTRVAKEKGFGECDVNKIDIYFIRDNGEIQKVKNLSEIKRHPLGVNWARQEDPNQRLFW